MNRKYAIFASVLILILSGFVVFQTGAQTSGVVGSLNFSPSNVKNGGVFTISLSGASSISGDTPTTLYINNGEGSCAGVKDVGSGCFRSFGEWRTVSSLSAGQATNTLNCSSYSSYTPGQAVNINGKVLNQEVYVKYGSTGTRSEVVSHTKDCSTPSPSGGACSVSPSSISIAQNGTVNMSVTTAKTSVSGDLIYVTATGFPTGSYSSLGNGQVIDAGKNRKDFQVFSTNNANRGQAQFTVYCSTGCPVSGCPSGGAPEILGSTQVSINVTGNNAEPVVGGGSGGATGSGSDACRVGGMILPPNSSDRIRIDFEDREGNINFSASTAIGSGISSVSAYPNIKIARVMNGSGREDPVVHVETGSSFSGSASYNLSCSYPHNKVDAVGVVSSPTVSNSAGKVKLTQMKDLKEILFPISECPNDVKGCHLGFEYGGPISVMSGATPPALVGSDMIALYPAPSKGNTAHPRLFNLTDPLRPIDSGLTGQIRAGGDYDTAGDFGPYLNIINVAYSKDKTVWAAKSSQGRIYVWKGGTRFEDWNGGDRAISGIIKYGFSYILLTNSGSYDISNGMTPGDSGIDFLSGNMWRRDNLNQPPAGFPNMPHGDKIILGDDKHILDIVLTDRFFNSGEKKRLAIYSAESPDVVAEMELPTSTAREQFGTIPVVGGEYIYVLRAPQSNSAMSFATYGPQFATIYKFDYVTKKITQVAKDVALSPGYISSHTAFGANTTNPGIVVSSFAYTTTAFDVQEAKIQVYLISDLIKGNGVDTLSNSPVWKDNTHRMMSAASLTVGGATYVYSDDSRVYKLEMGTASSETTPPVTTSTPPSGGGGSGVTPPTYDCNFDLSFIPTSLTVKEGTYYASYTIKANSSSVNPFCVINVIPPSMSNIRSDYMSSLAVSPGGQASMLLNVSKAAKGTYSLPVKAASKGVPMKTYKVELTIQ